MASTPALMETSGELETKTGPLAISLAAYLRTMFHPDREYVDGMAEERSVGEYEHSKVQFGLASFLMQRQQEWQIDVVGECRLQVRPDRFRIPDITVLRAGHRVNRWVTVVPLICIEVLSPEDRWNRLRQVTDDYRAMGVEHIWALDPGSREAFLCTADGFQKVEELVAPGTPIRVTLAEVFAVLG